MFQATRSWSKHSKSAKPDRKGIHDIPVGELQNDAFEAYYAAQGIVAPEEWDAFLASLKTPLPMVLRINR